MTDFRVTIAVREIRVKAVDRNQATDKAMGQLVENVATVTVTEVQASQTGFRGPEERAADD